MAIFKLNKNDKGQIKSVEEIIDCPNCKRKIPKKSYECPVCEWEFSLSN